MNSRNLIILVLVVILLLGGYFAFTALRPIKVTPSVPSVTTEASPAPVENTASDAAVVTENVVIISATGFSPKEITVKVGDNVTWVNSDTATQNVSSDPHPTHTKYAPLNLGNIPAGGKVALMFDKAGTYTYHDHLHPSMTGTVIVQ
jgi:plastocyanin